MNPASRFIRAHKDTLFQRWIVRVQDLPASEGVALELLRDHIPELLERIADSIESGKPSEGLEEISQRHGELRYEIGYELDALVMEYFALRQVLLEAFRDHPDAGPLAPADRIAFHAYLDRAIMEAIAHFMRGRERTRQLFLGVLGHDLRNPLNTISMMTQRLLSESSELEPRQVKRIKRVSSALGRMQRMIDELLDVTRGRLGHGIPIAPEECDLRELVSETVDDIRTVNPDRDIRLLERDGAEEFQDQWDWDRVQQAIANLLANAVNHGRDPIVVRLEARNREVAVVVENRGRIPPEMRAALFDPFRTTGANGGGLGLGLYIGREIARAHGGTIDLEDGSGDTTKFTLVLPRQPAS